MRKLWIFLIFSLLPLATFASVEFFTILPNPLGSDDGYEYIEIRNTGCQSIDISGYSLYDASGRNPYVFAQGSHIGSRESKKIQSPELTISLNNSGDESVILKDPSGNIIDQVDYTGTQKDDVVISLSPGDENCDTDTGTGNTGTGNTGTGDTGTGESDTSSGDASTGTTNTGTTDTSSVTSASGVLFPDIIPTRQEPTNATLSGNIWDCGSNQPCRINVTFEPIFTGSFLEKNYLCEVVTVTGTLTTCNPNTLYFSTGGSFGLRLTLISDLSQSRMVSWTVGFDTTNSGATSFNAGNQTPLNPPLTGGSGATNTGATDTGTINTGSTSTGSTTPSSGIIFFPEIIPTFQNYTNTNNSGDILTCVTSPCRVNITLDPIFTGSFLSRDYTCEVRYGTGVYDSCNPPQFYPIGTGSIDIRVIHRISGQSSTKTLQVTQNITHVSGGSSSVSTVPTNQLDINPPIAVLESDGKIYDYYEQIADHEFNCHAMTCSVNLTGERSYDPEGGLVRYLWIYGPNEIKTSRDPGGRKYGIGDHDIIMRVIDEAGNYSQIRYQIHVLGPRSEEKKIEKKKKETKLKNDTKEIEAKKGTQNQEKISAMVFFDPPEIVLQSSKFVLDGDRYICRAKTKNCSINLSLSGTQNGIVYSWDYGDGEILHSKNPRSHSYGIGDHVIHLTAGYDTDTPIWSRDILVSVERIYAVKKSKKPKIVQKQSEQLPTENDKNTKKMIESSVSAESIGDDFPYTTLVFISSIFPLMLVRRYITGT